MKLQNWITVLIVAQLILSLWLFVLWLQVGKPLVGWNGHTPWAVVIPFMIVCISNATLQIIYRRRKDG